jgi:hypothetical protein
MRGHGGGRIFRPTYTVKDGTVRSASVWWIAYWWQGRERRERAGTKAQALALLTSRQSTRRPAPRPGRRRLTSWAADGSRRGARGRQRHGLTGLKRVIGELGARTIDQAIDARTPLGRALAAGGAT